jgi:hypothetical protein
MDISDNEVELDREPGPQLRFFEGRLTVLIALVEDARGTISPPSGYLATAPL